jgi:hypothetical protein
LKHHKQYKQYNLQHSAPLRVFSLYKNILLQARLAAHACWLQVSLALPPRVALIAGLAVALLLGGVANGVAPKLWSLDSRHPLLWLDQLSYTR